MHDDVAKEILAALSPMITLIEGNTDAITTLSKAIVALAERIEKLEAPKNASTPK